MNEAIKLLTSRGEPWTWKQDDKIITCRRDNTTIHFTEKSKTTTTRILSYLNSRGVKDEELPPPPTNLDNIQIDFECFHRFNRANELLFVDRVGVLKTIDGMIISSEKIHPTFLNHHEYTIEDGCVYIDPQHTCKVTRKLLNRERVPTTLTTDKRRIILKCDYPWADLTIIMPTI